MVALHQHHEHVQLQRADAAAQRAHQQPLQHPPQVSRQIFALLPAHQAAGERVRDEHEQRHLAADGEHAVGQGGRQHVDSPGEPLHAHASHLLPVVLVQEEHYDCEEEKEEADQQQVVDYREAFRHVPLQHRVRVELALAEPEEPEGRRQTEKVRHSAGDVDHEGAEQARFVLHVQDRHVFSDAHERAKDIGEAQEVEKQFFSRFRFLAFDFYLVQS